MTTSTQSVYKEWEVQSIHQWYKNHSQKKQRLFAIEEQVGTVNHNHKGQFFVLLSFEHELGSTTLDCQLDV